MTGSFRVPAKTWCVRSLLSWTGDIQQAEGSLLNQHIQLNQQVAYPTYQTRYSQVLASRISYSVLLLTISDYRIWSEIDHL